MERTVGTISTVINFVKTQPVYTGTSHVAWKKVPAQMEKAQTLAGVREEKPWIM